MEIAISYFNLSSYNVIKKILVLGTTFIAFNKINYF